LWGSCGGKGGAGWDGCAVRVCGIGVRGKCIGLPVIWVCGCVGWVWVCVWLLAGLSMVQVWWARFEVKVWWDTLDYIKAL
jgi:hypothetical protein